MMKKIKLLCLPYAGASATIYYKFQPLLEENINLIPIELSGRGIRIDEPLLFSFEEAIEDVVYQIQANIKPEDEYMILGYSFGSLLGYEASKRLKKKPLHLFLAAFQPPMYKVSSADTLKLEDKEFVQKLVDSGGIEASIADNMDLLKYFIPIIRADFTSIEDYEFREPCKKLDCNATVLYTLEDEHSDKIHKWNNIFEYPCEYEEFTGNHFFIKREYNRIANIINRVSVRYI